MPLMLLPTLLTVLALFFLLWGEAREHAALMRVAKPLASTGFVAAALAMGALHDDYGRAILAALLLSWVGDVCLLSRRNAWFLAGLCAFLLGHVAFCVAFWVRGVDSSWAVGAGLGLMIPAMLVRRWLSPYVPSGMRRPVDAYVAVITVMVALSWACVAAGGTRLIAVGAMAFYLSDLAVARDRFVRRELGNRLWGLPLYYGAQLVLASTIGS